MSARDWLSNGERGISSETLCSAMLGIDVDILVGSWGADIPYDPDDFRRCLLLWNKATSKERAMGLREVVKICPKWKPFVREWSTLIELYNEESPTGSAPKLYRLMKKLITESEQGVI